MTNLLNLFERSRHINYLTEVLSGLTVALALVPEAIAFALIAGLSPLTGLYVAFSIGLITSIFGGRPGMISGATGAVAVVIVSLAQSHGVEYIFATVVFAGLTARLMSPHLQQKSATRRLIFRSSVLLTPAHSLMSNLSRCSAQSSQR